MRTLHMQYAYSIIRPIHMHTYIITRYVTVKHCTCIFIYANTYTFTGALTNIHVIINNHDIQAQYINTHF